MQKNRDCAEESGRTSVDTESLSFGAALLWGFAGCLLWGALCDLFEWCVLDAFRALER